MNDVTIVAITAVACAETHPGRGDASSSDTSDRDAADVSRTDASATDGGGYRPAGAMRTQALARVARVMRLRQGTIGRNG